MSCTKGWLPSQDHPETPAFHGSDDMELIGARVILRPANSSNVGMLISYTQDPAVQGAYKTVPHSTVSELEDVFLRSADRRYFEILTVEGESIGRFYLRAWRFVSSEASVDVEINIILKPTARGRGFGTEAQTLGIRYASQLFPQPVRSVFAYTDAGNVAEQRALLKCGMHLMGPAPSERYPISVAPNRFVLFATEANTTEGETVDTGSMPIRGAGAATADGSSAWRHAGELTS